MEIRVTYTSEVEPAKLPAAEREQQARDIAYFESAQKPMEWFERVGTRSKLPPVPPEESITNPDKPYFEKDAEGKSCPVNACAPARDKENTEQLGYDQSIRDGVRELVLHLAKRQKTRSRWTKQPRRET